MRSLRGHAGWNPLARLLARWSVVGMVNGKTAKVWRATPRDSQDVFEHSGWVWAVVLSPNGKTLVTKDNHTLV